MRGMVNNEQAREICLYLALLLWNTVCHNILPYKSVLVNFGIGYTKS
jgi:hypothetical protein